LGQNQPGNFGTIDVPATTNMLPGIGGSNAFITANGDLWLFGGRDQNDLYNELWHYEIDSICSDKSIHIGFTSSPDTNGGTPFRYSSISLTPKELPIIGILEILLQIQTPTIFFPQSGFSIKPRIMW
jgi:hypothetical protein